MRCDERTRNILYFLHFYLLGLVLKAQSGHLSFMALNSLQNGTKILRNEDEHSKDTSYTHS